MSQCLIYVSGYPCKKVFEKYAKNRFIGGKKTYIQSAYALPTEEKAETENKPFSLTGDSFPKIIVRHDIRKRWYDDNGILNIGIIDFLLDDSLL